MPEDFGVYVTSENAAEHAKTVSALAAVADVESYTARGADTHVPRGDGG